MPFTKEKNRGGEGDLGKKTDSELKILSLKHLRNSQGEVRSRMVGITAQTSEAQKTGLSWRYIIQ